MVWASLVALPAQSQDWATHDVCFPDKLELFEDTLAPFKLADLEAAAQTIPNATGRYWQITSPGGAVSHLWGTMHANDPRILALPDQVEADIRAARVVALETDFIFTSRADYARFATAEEIVRQDYLPFRFGILGLPPEIESWIRMRTDGIGWGDDAPDYLTLAGLASMLLGDPCSDFAAGTYPAQDSLIQTLGAMEGAEILALEPPNDFMDTLSDPQNFELTRALIAIYGAYLNPERTAQSTATGYALYLRGQLGVSMLVDRGYILEIFGDNQGGDWLALTNGYLVEQRNQTFLTNALPALDQGGVFMAIGGFHLPGDTGMIALLRKQGFTVERIAVTGEVQS